MRRALVRGRGEGRFVTGRSAAVARELRAISRWGVWTLSVARGLLAFGGMPRMARYAAGLALALAAFLPSRAAHAQESSDSAAMSANRGLRIVLGPTILMPTREGGPFGGGLSLDARYGLRAGPMVLAPGGRANGYLISSRFIGAAMPTFRVTVPVGPLAPFLVGGLGPGVVTNPGEAGLALMGGGGLMVHVSGVVAVGAEASYQVITGTEFRSLAIGPAITFGG